MLKKSVSSVDTNERRYNNRPTSTISIGIIRISRSRFVSSRTTLHWQNT